MNDIAERRTCAEPAPELWQSIPFDIILATLAVLVAAAFQLAGLMP